MIIFWLLVLVGGILQSRIEKASGTHTSRLGCDDRVMSLRVRVAENALCPRVRTYFTYIIHCQLN